MLLLPTSEEFLGEVFKFVNPSIKIQGNSDFSGLQLHFSRFNFKITNFMIVLGYFPKTIQICKLSSEVFLI